MLTGELDDIPTGRSDLSMGRVSQLLTAAEYCAMLGKAAEVEVLYPFVLEWTDRAPIRVFDFVITARVAGMCAALLERWDEAEGHFAKALDIAENQPDAPEIPAVQHRWGEMLHRRGDTHRAAGLLRSAVEGYRARSMPLHLAAAEALLREHAVSS
jgi:hypothetical protein